jgi:hypothetical protein
MNPEFVVFGWDLGVVLGRLESREDGLAASLPLIVFED